MRPVQAEGAALFDANCELLPRAQGGDMSAFEALVERHRDHIFAFGLRMTGSETDALEIAQESFLSACLHLSDFRNEADFAAWVHRIAASHASLRLRLLPKARAAAARLDPSRQHAGSALAHNPGADWSNELLERDLSPKLRRAIAETVDSLSPLDREVFLFKDVSALSYEQVARICGESIAAVKSRLHQARMSLRQAIDRFYSAEVKAA